MKQFSPAHLEEMAKLPRFLDDTSEQECPACGKTALRTYVFRFDRPRTPVIITNTWCAACRRMAGSTGPLPRGLIFSDPWASLSRAEREQLGGEEIFRRLDDLWDRGILPQRFTIKR